MFVKSYRIFNNVSLCPQILSLLKLFFEFNNHIITILRASGLYYYSCLYYYTTLITYAVDNAQSLLGEKYLLHACVHLEQKILIQIPC